MKKTLFYTIIFTVLVAVGSFYGCNDTVGTENDGRVRGVSILPNPMTVGGLVSISGPNFKDATAIVFPGNVRVTDFSRAGDSNLSAIVPAGAAREGNISISFPDREDFIIPFNVTIFTTQNLRAESKDTNKETGNVLVGPNDALTIRGEGLGTIVEVILPGGLSINSINFAKKTDASIEFAIPMGGFDVTAVEPVKLVNSSGEVFYTLNQVDFSGEGYVPPGLLLFAGRTYKVWTWDEKVERPWGNGSWANDTGPNPSWWTLPLASLPGQIGANEAAGATMRFELPNKMIKTLANGTVLEGFFNVVMGSVDGTKAIGKLVITGGDSALTILGGTYSGNANTKEYPFTHNDGVTMTLMLRATNGDGYFSMFRAIEGDLPKE
jgi:hypothetical protein